MHHFLHLSSVLPFPTNLHRLESNKRHPNLWFETTAPIPFHFSRLDVSHCLHVTVLCDIRSLGILVGTFGVNRSTSHWNIWGHCSNGSLDDILSGSSFRAVSHPEYEQINNHTISAYAGDDNWAQKDPKALRPQNRTRGDRDFKKDHPLQSCRWAQTRYWLWAQLTLWIRWDEESTNESVLRWRCRAHDLHRLQRNIGTLGSCLKKRIIRINDWLTITLSR